MPCTKENFLLQVRCNNSVPNFSFEVSVSLCVDAYPNLNSYCISRLPEHLEKSQTQELIHMQVAGVIDCQYLDWMKQPLFIGYLGATFGVNFDAASADTKATLTILFWTLRWKSAKII